MYVLKYLDGTGPNFDIPTLSNFNYHSASFLRSCLLWLIWFRRGDPGLPDCSRSRCLVEVDTLMTGTGLQRWLVVADPPQIADSDISSGAIPSIASVAILCTYKILNDHTNQQSIFHGVITSTHTCSNHHNISCPFSWPSTVYSTLRSSFGRFWQ